VDNCLFVADQSAISPSPSLGGWACGGVRIKPGQFEIRIDPLVPNFFFHIQVRRTCCLGAPRPVRPTLGPIPGNRVNTWRRAVWSSRSCQTSLIHWVDEPEKSPWGGASEISEFQFVLEATLLFQVFSCFCFLQKQLKPVAVFSCFCFRISKETTSSHF